jgi:hypothetical protein
MELFLYFIDFKKFSNFFFLAQFYSSKHHQWPSDWDYKQFDSHPYNSFFPFYFPTPFSFLESEIGEFSTVIVQSLVELFLEKVALPEFNSKIAAGFSVPLPSCQFYF